MPFSEESLTLVSMLFSLSFNHIIYYYILNLIFIASLNKHMHKCKHTLVLLTFQVEEKVLIPMTIHLQVGIPYNLILLSKCTHSRLVLTVIIQVLQIFTQ